MWIPPITKAGAGLVFALVPAAITAALTAQSWVRLDAPKDLPLPTGSTEQTSCVVGDFDGDGRDDFLIGSRRAGGKIELWLSGANLQFTRYPVEPGVFEPEAGGAAWDIDGDGDLDAVFGQDIAGDKIFWWENPAPNFGNPWTRRLIKSGLGTKHHDQMFGDFDGDGKGELVSWNQGVSQLLMFDIPANPKTATSWPYVVVASNRGQDEGLAKADLDGDGQLDIIGGGSWWKYAGNGRFTEFVIDATQGFTRAAAGQLIPGGRPEVVFTPGDADGQGYWYQWVNNAWVRHDLIYCYHGHTLEIADINGDGALDIVSGEMRLATSSNELRVLYGDGQGGFTKVVMQVGVDVHEGKLADVNGDGAPDIIHKPFNYGTPALSIWINPGRRLAVDRWNPILIDGNLTNNAVFVRHGDLDGDGRIDAIAGDAWLRNPGPSGIWARTPIGAPFRNVALVFDADGDGDLDLFGTQGAGASANADFAWAENDGRGNFTVHTNIQKGTGDFLQGAVVGRLAGPNSPLYILLSWHASGHGIQMLTVPASPTTKTWPWQKVSPVSQDEALSLGDVDGDGDPDLLLGTVWLEIPTLAVHTMGTVADLPGVNSNTPEPDRNCLVDIDGDGDLDAVVGLEYGRDVVWFENPRPQGSPTGTWPRHILGNAFGQGLSLDVGDLDGDGDMDVVLGEHMGATVNRILMFENRVRSAGQKTNWNVHVIDSRPVTEIDHHDGTQLVDVDGDGDLDILSVGWIQKRVWLFENLASQGGGPQGNAATPILNPPGGVFRAFRFATLTSSTPGAEIRYTLDGSEPSTASTKYTGPLLIGDNADLVARTFATGYQPSAVVRGAFARMSDELAHWRFDEGSGATARDDSPGGRHGSVRNATWSGGRVESGLLFNGSTSRVELGTMDVTGGALTLSAWIAPIRLDHLASGDARILSKASATDDASHYLMLSTILVGSEHRLRFRLKTGGQTTTLIAGAGSVPAGRWSHVTATYDGQEMALYLDGQRVGSTPKSGAITANPAVSTWIGDQPPSGTRAFEGYIDDVRIYARALTGLEIRALAEQTTLRGTRRIGWPTPSCGQFQTIDATCAPGTQSTCFAITGAGATARSIGLVLIGSHVQSPPWRWLGVDLWPSIVPNTVLVVAAVQADASGRILLPIPMGKAPVGGTVFGQFVWQNPASCPGTPNLGVSASDAMMFQAFLGT